MLNKNSAFAKIAIPEIGVSLPQQLSNWYHLLLSTLFVVIFETVNNGM
jgi:hypothetical protein